MIALLKADRTPALSRVQDPTILVDLPASKEFGRRRLELVPTNMIEDWIHNPDVRTEALAMRELTPRFNHDIGQLVPCSAISYEAHGVLHYRLIDGHRRKKVAEKEGIHALEVIHYLDVDPDSDQFGKLFDVHNGGNRLVNMRERTGLALDGEKAAAGKQAIKYADTAVHNLNSAGLEAFREANQPNSALGQARNAYRELSSRKLIETDARSQKAFMSSCFTWQIHHSQQRKLIGMLKLIHLAAGRGSAAKATRLASKLLCYITTNEPIPDEIALVPGHLN